MLSLLSPNGTASVRISRERLAARHDRVVRLIREHQQRVSRFHEQVRKRDEELLRRLKDELLAPDNDDPTDSGDAAKFVHG